MLTRLVKDHNILKNRNIKNETLTLAMFME